jgi:hypothetical protein
LALVGVGLLAGCGGGSSSSTDGTTVVVHSQLHNVQQKKLQNAQHKNGGAAPTYTHTHAAKKAKAKSETNAKPSQKSTSKKTKPPQGGSTGSNASATTAASPTTSSPAVNSLGGASPVAIRKLRKHCPKNVGSKACTAMVESFVAAQGTEAKSLNSPEECVASRGKAECEEILRQQSEAAGGESVNVQECLANMTPKCEEILRPYFESRQASEAAGGQ